MVVSRYVDGISTHHCVGDGSRRGDGDGYSCVYSRVGLRLRAAEVDLQKCGLGAKM